MINNFLNFDFKQIIAFAALVAVAMAAPQQTRDQDITVVNETPLDNIGVSDYKYGYQLSNGATKEESAQLVAGAGPEEGPSYQVVGSYSWVNPFDNVQYIVKYTADKDGFHPVADHIPK